MRRGAHQLLLKQLLALSPLGLALLWLPWPRISQELFGLSWCDLLLLLAAAGTVLCAVFATAGEALDTSSGYGAPGAGEQTSSTADQVDPMYAAHVKIMDMISGVMTVSNGAPLYFESELASGSYVLLHRPSGPAPDGPQQGGGSDLDPHAYFEGKKRLWEMRLQCTFKKAVHSRTLRLASHPFERQPVGPGQVQLHRWLIKMAGPALRGLYHSPGDDPRGRAENDIEHPLTSVPICECDQYIREGAPSLLSRDFHQLGLVKARDPEFRRRMPHIIFQAGETHTFAFWGPSRAFNIIGWQMSGIPMFQGVSMDTVNGPPPLCLCVYYLSPGDYPDGRHLPSRMEVVMKAAGWSSAYPPSAERMEMLRYLATGVYSEDDCRRLTSLSSHASVGGREAALALRRQTPCCGCGLRQLFCG